MYTVNNFNTVFVCIQKYLCHFKFRFTSNFTWSIIGPFVEFWKSPLIASYISLFTLNACLQVQYNMSLRGYSLWSEYSWLYLQSSHPSNQKACHNSKFFNFSSLMLLQIRNMRRHSLRVFHWHRHSLQLLVALISNWKDYHHCYD